MNEDIIMKLDDTILSGLEGLDSLDPGSEEMSKAVDNIVRLYKLRIEDSKVAVERDKEMNENDYKRDQMDLEERYRKKTLESTEKAQKEQLKEQRIDRCVKIGLAGAELLIPLIFYACWMDDGFKFEKEGTYTSKTFMNLINRFRPTKL